MRVVVVVNSHAAFAEHTLSKLLASLVDVSRVPFENIAVIVGGIGVGDGVVPLPPSDIFSGVHAVAVPWNSIDNTAFAWLGTADGQMLLESCDWILYIHDTCVAGPRFYSNAEDFARARPDDDIIKLHEPHYSMSMGLYNSSWLLRHADVLEGLAAYPADSAHVMALKSWPTEDAVIKYGDAVGARVSCMSSGCVYKGREDVYGTGTMRHIEYYDALDLLKYKANKDEMVCLDP